MSSLMQNTEALAHKLFGPDAEVLTKHEEGRVQWWVRDPQKKQVIATETLRDLHDALEQKDKIQMAEANGDLITSEEAGRILGYDSGGSRVLALVKLGLLNAQYVPGPGQGHRQSRFQRAQVEALAASKPTPGHAWPQNKQNGAKPKHKKTSPKPEAKTTDEPLLTSKQIASIAGLKPQSIPGAVKDYGLPVAARGTNHRLLFRESDVREWAAKRERKAPSRKPAVISKYVERYEKTTKTRRIVVDVPIGLAIKLEDIIDTANKSPFKTDMRTLVTFALQRMVDRGWTE